MKQFDKTTDQNGKQLQFEIYKNDALYEIPSDAIVTIRGTKPDITGYEYECEYDSNIVKVNVRDQMTVCAGRHNAEIRISKDGNVLSTANVIFNIERSAISSGTSVSKTDLPLIEKAVEAYDKVNGKVEETSSYAEEAKKQATNAKTSAEYIANHADKIDKLEDGLNNEIDTREKQVDSLKQELSSGKYNGKDGKDGVTPVYGKDYFTTEQVSQFKQEVINSLPSSASTATRAIYDQNGRMLTPKTNSYLCELGNPTLFEIAAGMPSYGNKTIFYPKQCFSAEYSDDLGETWNAIEISQQVHNSLFSSTYEYNPLLINALSDPADSNSNVRKFRMTILAYSYYYTDFMYLYTSGNGIFHNILVEKKKIVSQEWETMLESNGINLGWPGHFLIPFTNIPFQANNTTDETKYDAIRVTITPNDKKTSKDYMVNRNWKLYHVALYGGYPSDKSFNGISIDADNNHVIPYGLKIGDTVLDETKLKKLLDLIS